MRSIVIGFVLFLAIVLPAQAQQRVALVIGNGEYKRAGWALPNPPNDARMVAEALEELDFDVAVELNLGEVGMRRAFKDYSRRLAAAGPDAIGLFYYAGHGVESEGHNFLIPTDARPETEEDIWYEAPRLGLLMRGIERAGNAVNFVILDACRNNPLPSSSRSIGGGLAEPKRQRGQLFAYATEPGQTAADGKGALNSPYSRALVDWLMEPGLVVETVFKRVADQVHTETSGRQTPFFNSGLIGTDVFLAGPKEPPGQSELDAFKSAKTPCDFAAFALAYPGSALGAAASALSVGCKAPTTEAALVDVVATTSPTFDRIGADFDFGINDDMLTGDEACADPRFTGPGMSPPPWRAGNTKRDAADCSAAWDAGRLLLRTQESLGIGNIGEVHDGIDFGTDDGAFANDGLCNDSQFTGTSMGREDHMSDARTDRSDCLVAYMGGTVRPVSE